MTDTPPAHLLYSSQSAPPPLLTTASATAATAGNLPPPQPRSPNSSGGGINAAAAEAEEQADSQPQSPIAALRSQRPPAAFDPLRSPLLARRSINAAEQGAALAQTSSLFNNSAASPNGPGEAGAYSNSAMALTRRARALLRLRLRSGEAKAEVSDLRLEAEELFVALAGLVSFVDINKTGFRKALKKHDKVAVVAGVPGLEARPLAGSETAETIARAFDERCRTSSLEVAMEAVVLSYAVLATGGELGASAAELRGRLRDRLVIERGTVWQEMVSRERRTAAARVVGGGGGGERGGGIGGPGGLRRGSLEFGRGVNIGDAGAAAAAAAAAAAGGSGHGGQAARKLLLGPAAASAAGTSAAAAAAAASRSAASCFGSTTALAIAFAAALFFALLASPLFPHEPEKRNCLALLAFVSALWTTEAIPLYATSMLVPALVIALRVMVSPLPDPETGHRRRLLPKEAAPLVFSAMMSQVIMLLLGEIFYFFFSSLFFLLPLDGKKKRKITSSSFSPASLLLPSQTHATKTKKLGGFAMAAALSKHYVAKWAASAVLGRLGRSPASLLLASMGVAAFLSMWISNVAAPVLVYSLLAPVLRTLPPRGSSRSGDHMGRALALGVALASNLGGMTSPISSPQNVFAIERMAHAAAAASDGSSGPGWLEWFAVALPVAGAGVVACWGALLLAYPAARTASVRSLARQAGAPAQRFTGVQVRVFWVLGWRERGAEGKGRDKEEERKEWGKRKLRSQLTFPSLSISSLPLLLPSQPLKTGLRRRHLRRHRRALVRQRLPRARARWDGRHRHLTARRVFRHRRPHKGRLQLDALDRRDAGAGRAGLGCCRGLVGPAALGGLCGSSGGAERGAQPLGHAGLALRPGACGDDFRLAHRRSDGDSPDC